MRFRKFRIATILLTIGSLNLAPLPLPRLGADTITNKNGCQYEGTLGWLPEIGANVFDLPSGEVQSKKVIIVDDGLRRTYIPSTQLATNPAPGGQIYERIKVDQLVSASRAGVGEVGQPLYVSPFDEYGRRFVRITSELGPIELHQGITEITPIYCEVEGLQTEKHSYRWKLSVATSSIPRETLSQIIYKQIDPTSPAERLKVVTLYQQANRHKDAVEELQQIIADFPELKDLSRSIDSLRAAYAGRIIDEIETRMDAGQHELALAMIESFPTDDIASEILGEVLELKNNQLRQMAQVDELRKLFATVTETVRKSTELSEQQAAGLTRIATEIDRDLNLNNVARLASFRRFADDPSKTADEKAAYAISGWLLGATAADGNFVVALTQVTVRELVREYLTTADAARRAEILSELETMEGSLPESLARLVENMLPLDAVPQEPEQGIPGFYRLTIPGVDESHQIEYVVQLPPEYDPYRRYPCIMTLGDAMSPAQQVAWWAGGFGPRHGMRMGQASRLGYIVISPKWQLDGDPLYRYSGKEHAAVLYSLQDAVRRFSIDTDRVFLTGHSQGGTAAWDIGLAHPDLWAGVVPIVASAGKYIQRYWENPRHQLAFYFVHGEKDNRRMLANKAQWNRYFRFHGFDVTISEYLGRGHEHFYEDIHRIFEWMQLHRRDFWPEEFACVSLRPFDNFFWFVESRDHRPTNVILPPEWPKADIQDGITSARFTEQNRLTVRTPGLKSTVWLSPEIVDFSQPFSYRINGERHRNEPIEPSREVLLEDVRTRGDRQHPFWSKIEIEQAR